MNLLAPFRRRGAPEARAPLAEAAQGRAPKNRLAGRFGRSRRKARRGSFAVAESLERRLALAVDVTPITGDEFFFVDTKTSGRVLDSEYSGYSIFNDSLTEAYDDVWVVADDFTGGAIGLAPNEDGFYYLGRLDPQETDKAWIYLTGTGEDPDPQSHNIYVYEGDPRQPGSTLIGGPQLITFTQVVETIKSSSNTVNSVAYDTATPVLGGTITMYVVGNLGQAGGDSVLFSPDTFNTWQPDVYQLETTKITILGTNARVVTDELFLTGFAQEESNVYHAEYTFRLMDVIATSTPVSPTQYVGGKTPWKHDEPQGVFPPIPAVTNQLTLEKFVAEVGSMAPPAHAITVPNNAATVEYSLTFTNASGHDVTLDSIRDTLPPGVTYVPGSAKFGGLPIGDPSFDPFEPEKLSWFGPFVVPKMGTATLTFQATMPTATGVYVNSSVGRIGCIQIDTTAYTKDDFPATAIVTVAEIAKLSIEKTDYPDPVRAGGSGFTYTIKVSNSLGYSDAQDVVVTDTLPPGFVAYAFDPSTDVDLTETGFTWTVGTLPAGETRELLVTYSVDSNVPADTYTNRASVTSPTDPTPPPEATCDTTVETLAELSIEKTGDEFYKAGGPLSFTLTVKNKGPSDASGVHVVDSLPAGVVSWTWTVQYDLGPVSLPSTTPIDVFIDLAVGVTAKFAITAQTLAGYTSNITNNATATLGQTTWSASWTSTYDGQINPTQDVRALVVTNDDRCFSEPYVNILDADTGAALYPAFLAYEPSFRGSVRVATADFGEFDSNGVLISATPDGVDEIVTAPGRARVGEIRVFTVEGVELTQYKTLPFGPKYRGGVDVAVGDVDGDGYLDIVAARASGLAQISVFRVDPLAVDPVANVPIRSFVGIPGSYRNGAVVTVGDYGTFVTGSPYSATPDGIDEIAVGTNAGIRAAVRVFDASPITPRLVGSFNPFGSRFRGGVTLSSARWTGGGDAEDIIVGAGVGGKSMIEVYRGNPFSRIDSISAYSTAFARPNAVVNAVALAIDGTASLYAVQGRGSTGGTRGVTRFDGISTSPLPGSTFLTPPLRIAPITLQVLGG